MLKKKEAFKLELMGLTRLLIIVTGILVGILVSLIIVYNYTETSAIVELTVASKEKSEWLESEFKSDTINKPDIVKSETDGSLRLKAGKGRAIGPNIKFMPKWRAFGWFTARDFVQWDVNVAKAGKYKVLLEWSVSDKEAGKEFLLEANGRKLVGVVPPSGSWETFKIAAIGNIKLKAGKQIIAFKSKKYFNKGAILDLREIRLVPLN